MERSETQLAQVDTTPIFEDEPKERAQWPPRLLEEHWLDINGQTLGVHVSSYTLRLNRKLIHDDYNHYVYFMCILHLHILIYLSLVVPDPNNAM